MLIKERQKKDGDKANSFSSKNILEKQSTFMNPSDVAKTIIDNVTKDSNLTVDDIVIEKN